MKQDVVIRSTTGKALERFDPRKTKIRVAGLKAAIAHARVIKDWALGEDTIELLLDETERFLAWWEASVTPGWGGENKGQGRSKAILTAEDATAATGITGKRVSRWRQRFADKEAYRLALRRALHRVHLTEAFEPHGLGGGGTVSNLNDLVASGRRFATIMPDPPWEFTTWSDEASRSAKRHYDTQKMEWLKALPVQQLAAEPCALLMWATWPNFTWALELIEAWGFRYKTAAYVWVKTNKSGEGLFTGMGYYTRANTEPCLLATRGVPKRMSKSVHQVIMSPVGEHSEKPDEAYARTMELFDGEYLEMFARKPREGWWVWGDEVSDAAQSARYAVA